MIAADLADHLLNIISWHRTWLAAMDFNTIGSTVVLNESNQLKRKSCRMFRFEVRIAKFGFRRYQIISLPEYSIESAMQRLSADAGFAVKLQHRNLSYKDVNEIIRIASDDTIDLELESYT